MRLVTWNLNSLKARMPRLLELLDEHAPDVLCVQETKVAADAFPHLELAMVGYRAVDRSEGRWNGVAILVPEDAEVDEIVTELPGEPAAAEARWVEARVRGVRVASTYVPNGREPSHPMFATKLAFLAAVRERAAAMVASGPTVIAGDLNVAPEDRDVWDPAAFVGSTHVTDQERAAVRAVAAAGLDDAFRAVSEDPGFTWWDYRAGAFHRQRGMRIDLVLATPDLTVRDARVERTYRKKNRAGDAPSDHAPLLVEFDRS